MTVNIVHICNTIVFIDNNVLIILYELKLIRHVNIFDFCFFKIII